MVYEFRWNDWNLDHVEKHGVSPKEAEHIVVNARRPYPRHEGARKYRVRGQTAAGDYLQVIYLIDTDRTLYIIHARPLSETEKRQFRRSSR
jgi:uncharacterized DUF497 family protein